MSSDNLWIATEIMIDQDGDLVIDAMPGYGNRKRWEGAMDIHLSPGKLDDLLKKIEAHKAQKRLIEVASDEMKEFLELFKAEYLEKRQTVADTLELNDEVIPRPCWYQFELPNVPVQFL